MQDQTKSLLFGRIFVLGMIFTLVGLGMLLAFEESEAQINVDTNQLDAKETIHVADSTGTTIKIQIQDGVLTTDKVSP